MINKIKDKSIEEVFFKLIEKSKKQLLMINEYYGLNLIKINKRKNSNYFNNLIDIKQLNLDELVDEEIEFLLDNYLAHKFDLLGSGWLKVDYNISPIGLEGNKYEVKDKFDNLTENILKKILRRKHYWRAKKYYNLINKEYRNIDWQIDFKSGYRYSEKIFYKSQPIAPKPGVDIKVPWELARLQHLLQLAIFSIKYREKRNIILNEYKNQVLDFIMMNPPNMGVNWTCAMEVGIRSINLLLSFDILKQIDSNEVLDNKFLEIFIEFIEEHRSFIENNFEWSKRVRNNHYLSNLVGLLYIETYLDKNENDHKKINFTIKQLIYELDKQFNLDGSNFEASTCYHVLSGELMLLTVCILNRVKLFDSKQYFESSKNKNNFIKIIEKKTPNFNLEEKYKSILNKLFLSSQFVEDVTFNNEIIQIGDNDSGRIIKLTPNLHYDYENKFRENFLNKLYYVASVNGLFYTEEKYKAYNLEYSFIRSLVNKNKISSFNNMQINKHEFISCDNTPYNFKYICEVEFKFEEYGIKKIDIESLTKVNYPNFGLAILRNENVFLSIMYGDIGQDGNGGHAHNDKLSIELIIDKHHVLMDKGSYLYTPIPEKRNQYRSAISHNIPVQVMELEQDYLKTLFSTEKRCYCELLEFSNSNIKAIMKKNDLVIIREIKLNEEKIKIVDKSNYEIRQNFNFNTKISIGYGILNEYKRY